MNVNSKLIKKDIPVFVTLDELFPDIAKVRLAPRKTTVQRLITESCTPKRSKTADGSLRSRTTDLDNSEHVLYCVRSLSQNYSCNNDAVEITGDSLDDMADGIDISVAEDRTTDSRVAEDGTVDWSVVGSLDRLATEMQVVPRNFPEPDLSGNEKDLFLMLQTRNLDGEDLADGALVLPDETEEALLPASFENSSVADTLRSSGDSTASSSTYILVTTRPVSPCTSKRFPRPAWFKKNVALPRFNARTTAETASLIRDEERSQSSTANYNIDADVRAGSSHVTFSAQGKHSSLLAGDSSEVDQHVYNHMFEEQTCGKHVRGEQVCGKHVCGQHGQHACGQHACLDKPGDPDLKTVSGKRVISKDVSCTPSQVAFKLESRATFSKYFLMTFSSADTVESCSSAIPLRQLSSGFMEKAYGGRLEPCIESGYDSYPDGGGWLGRCGEKLTKWKSIDRT
ncbi:hypothetical protein GNI_133330 [Gregarina niphandrodes]|uniref:Uncharacterized protein n=1 Tax=Gregarina niphandrodes TaxID=110365 RepID=A0A023B1J2_GRENI|nr:hypothetical protein GNI_133330 [Gregarina niphandrodes]EZG46765.1 hypothetical protein GNI_133330 [Gregarina niphandrodes]|eukprot:XP_011132274.1 hypothetical protein GNI_133330 [Gregarina niphandrodes]